MEVVPSSWGCRAARDARMLCKLACQRKSWIRGRTSIAFGRSVSVFVFTDVGRCCRHRLCDLIDSRFFLAAWRSPFRARSGDGCRATPGITTTWLCRWPSRRPTTGVAAWALWTLALVLAVFFAGCFLGRRSAGASVGGTLCIAQEGGTAVQILHDSDGVAASSGVLSNLPKLPTSARKTIRDGGLALEAGLADRELRLSRFRGG